MFALYQTLLIMLAGFLAIRLGMVLRERQFAQSLLVAGGEWTKLQGGYLLHLRQGALWKFYLWTLGWRRLSDSPFDVTEASDLKASCLRWLAFDAVTGIACVGLLLMLWKLGVIR